MVGGCQGARRESFPLGHIDSLAARAAVDSAAIAPWELSPRALLTERPGPGGDASADRPAAGRRAAFAGRQLLDLGAGIRTCAAVPDVVAVFAEEGVVTFVTAEPS